MSALIMHSIYPITCKGLFTVLHGAIASAICLLQLMDSTHHESEDRYKSVASSASLLTYNVRTKGIQYKSMVKSVHNRRLLLLANS